MKLMMKVLIIPVNCTFYISLNFEIKLLKFPWEIVSSAISAN